MRGRVWALAAVPIVLTVQPEPPSPVRTDETVVLFPTGAHPAPDGSWVVPLHGWIYEAEADSRLRRGAIDEFAEALGINENAAGAECFRVRAALFLVDNERGKCVPVRIGGSVFTSDPSASNGHFHFGASLPANFEPPADGRVRVSTVPPEGDARAFAGTVYLVPATGVSVVSDIDDTIKRTGVGEPAELLERTFCRPFEPVPGMADAYRRWADAGAAFHYVSTSPWQLYGPLQEFLDAEGFPAGTVDLQQFRWKDETFSNLFEDSDVLKEPVVRALLDRWAGRTFVLVGDSSERDPELYGRFAAARPGQIAHVYILNTTNEPRDSARYRECFGGIGPERWTVFDDSGALPGQPAPPGR